MIVVLLLLQAGYTTIASHNHTNSGLATDVKQASCFVTTESLSMKLSLCETPPPVQSSPHNGTATWQVTVNDALPMQVGAEFF